MRAYSTLSGAARAAGGSPIVRLLADPQETFIVIPSLDTSIYVLTADSPQSRRHENAGSVNAMDIIDLDIARRERPWPVLRVVDDADNENNRRIVTGPGSPICKVYGFTPEEAQHKAEIIVGALGGLPIGEIEVVKILRDLVRRCDGEEGVRANGSNIDTRAANMLLAKIDGEAAE